MALDTEKTFLYECYAIEYFRDGVLYRHEFEGPTLVMETERGLELVGDFEITEKGIEG